MANDLSKFIPQLLAMGLLELREAGIGPRLVNLKYSPLAGEHGSSIDVPISSAIAVQDVTPAATPPSTADVTSTMVSIPLTRWKEAPFVFTDKEAAEVVEGTFPRYARQAIKAIANEVCQFLYSLGSKFYGFVGTPGTTPFGSDTTDATNALVALNTQLAPLDPRHIVLDPRAQGNALNLRAFQDTSWSGTPSAIMEGRLNQRLGFNWWMDQNIRTFAAGTCPTSASFLVNNGGGHAIGIKTINVDNGSGSGAAGTVKVGDVITFAGHSQTYVVVSGTPAPVADVITTPTVLVIEPGLVAAVADNEAVAIKGRATTYVNNLFFHPDAIALVTRPLAGSMHPASIIESAIDPVTGLALRLEMTREHKRDRFSFDILYGAEVIRRELGGRIAG